MPLAEILHEDASLRLGLSRNLLTIAWLGSPESPQLQALGRAMASLTAKHRQDAGMLNIVVSGAPRFTDAVRNEVVRLLREPRLQLRGGAHVVLTPGLAGVATRAFLSTATLLARAETPHRVFGELRPAAAWLAPLLSAGGTAWSVEEILAAQAEATKVEAPAAAKPDAAKPAAKPAAKRAG
jgi:hypothetical protein